MSGHKESLDSKCLSHAIRRMKRGRSDLRVVGIQWSLVMFLLSYDLRLAISSSRDTDMNLILYRLIGNPLK